MPSCDEQLAEVNMSGGITQYQFNAPAGLTFKVQYERNNTVTVSLENAYGEDMFKYNSGVTMFCYVLSGGISMMVYTYTMNPGLTALTFGLSNEGCQKIYAGSWEDGDEYADFCK